MQHRPDDSPAAATPSEAGADAVPADPLVDRDAFRWRHLVDAPALVWLLTVTHLLLLVTYSVAVPTFRAPDEAAHVDLVLALQDDPEWPDPYAHFFRAEVSEAMLHSRFSLSGSPADIDLRALEAHDAPPRPERPTFAELAGDGATPWHNQMAQHPPLHYLAGHTVLLWSGAFTPDVHWSYDRVVGLLRLLSVVLVAGLPLAVHAVARRLRACQPVATAAAVIPLGIPMLTHVGSTVTNDSLLIALFAALFVVLTYVATGDSSRRTAVWVGLLTSLALLTKGFALVVPAWAAAAYGLALVRRRGWDRPTVAAGAVALVTMSAGGWWWVRNLVVHGTLQPRGGSAFVAPVGATTADRPFLEELARVPERFWGAFGWTQAIIPQAVALAATLLTLAGVGATVALHRSDRRWPRADVAVLLLPSLLVTGLVVLGAWESLSRTGMVLGLQGRYLFAGVVGLAVAAVLWGDRLAPSARAWLPVAALVAAGAMQATAMVVVLGHFYGGLDLSANARALAHWAPWPPAGLLALAGALVLVGVVTGAAAVRDAARGVDRRRANTGATHRPAPS